MTLSSLAIYIVAFVFVLGVLIFIHELGHFLVARLLGIEVQVFSLGFGKRLFGIRRGQTDYRISMIPLGGYVKMAGENPDEELSGSPNEFLSRPRWQRFCVAVAGPLMNLVLAVVLLAATMVVGRQVYSFMGEPGVVGFVEPDSPAARVGLKAGDLIKSVNGWETPTWKQVEFRIGVNPDQDVDVEFVRQGTPMKTEVHVDASEDGHGDIGLLPMIPYVVSELADDSAAEKAGIRSGDEIVAVWKGEQRNTGFEAIASVVRESNGSPLVFEIVRDGHPFKQTIAPEMTEEGPRLGAYVRIPTEAEQLGPIDALGQSIHDNYDMAVLTFVTIGRLVTGSSSVKQLSGPIEIAKFSGKAAILGIVPLLGLMSLISLQLGLLNLLPIPVLDGGLIALLALEGLMGRDLSLEMKERIFKAGFVFLVVLMGVVLFNDVAKNLPGF